MLLFSLNWVSGVFDLLRNTLKSQIKSGQVVYGTMLQEMTTPTAAQIFKRVGFDFFMVDCEHGAFDLGVVREILRVARLEQICPLVRIRNLDYSLVAGHLDAGAMGLMLPRVESVEHTRGLVNFMKYPPVGVRGLSSDAPHSDYVFGDLEEFVKVQNEDTLAIAQIERKVAVENLEEILSVPGIDVALIGPEDLSLSYGMPGQTDHPVGREAIERVIDISLEAGVAPGIHMGNIEKLTEWRSKGMQVIMYNSDLGFLLEGAESGLNALKS